MSEDLTQLLATVVEMMDIYLSLIYKDLTTFDVCDTVLELMKRHKSVLAWMAQKHDTQTLVKAQAILAPYNGIMSYVLSQGFVIALPLDCRQWYKTQVDQILSSPRLR